VKSMACRLKTTLLLLSLCVGFAHVLGAWHGVAHSLASDHGHGAHHEAYPQAHQASHQQASHQPAQHHDRLASAHADHESVDQAHHCAAFDASLATAAPIIQHHLCLRNHFHHDQRAAISEQPAHCRDLRLATARAPPVPV